MISERILAVSSIRRASLRCADTALSRCSLQRTCASEVAPKMRFRDKHWATMRFPWSAPPAPPPLPPPLTIAGKVLSFTAPSVTDSTFPAIATAVICIVLTIVAILIVKKRTKLALLPEHLRLGVTLAVRTHKSGAKFDVAMSSAQKAAFDTALVEDFDSIETSLSKVDVSKATCRNPADTRAILDLSLIHI